MIELIKGIKYAISFLTIIPVSHTDIDKVAKYMHVFPIVGAIIGVIIGLLGYGLSIIFAPILTGLLVSVSIVIITGMHHVDGLIDFVDGLAAKGTRVKKINAMKDVAIGSAGVVGAVLYLIGLVVVLSFYTGGFDMFRAILLSEILAKFSMVLISSLGSSATVGSSSPFTSAMKNKTKLIIAFIIVIVLIIIIDWIGFVMLGMSITITIFILAVSTRSFGGITGDVIGTTNELARLASLMVFVLL